MKTEAIAACAICAFSAFAGAIDLPPPAKTDGMPLVKALSLRSSAREFADRDVPVETLSSLLWAANGKNRADGHRTAPTGRDVRDIDLYAMTRQGVYLYDPDGHRLLPVNDGDHRKAAGKQPFAQNAPLNLFMVQNLDRSMKAATPEDGAKYAGIHAGAIMQNIYLFAASANLNTVARGYFDEKEVSAALKLGKNQKPLLAQSVGFGLRKESANPREKAVLAALADANAERNAISGLSVKEETEDGVSRYEIEFRHGGFEYEYEISLDGEKILKSEKEKK